MLNLSSGWGIGVLYVERGKVISPNPSGSSAANLRCYLGAKRSDA
jgi:hypothetical protein